MGKGFVSEEMRQGLRDKGWSDAKIDKNEELLMKVGGFVFSWMLTGIADTGAGILSICSRSKKPLSVTHNWCRRNLFFDV